MLSKLIRKARQLQGDPVLRRWLVGRLLGRWSGAPDFRPHRPPYLQGLLPLGLEAPVHDVKELPAAKPQGPLVLELAGQSLKLEPGDETDLFKRRFDDVETLLSLHRFAWLSDTIELAWVSALWRAWLEGFAQPSEDWPWHPYTASERAVNILGFARRHGLPGPVDETTAALAAHAPAIAAGLEYFGDHHTSNHLANNGRGLLMLGLALGLPRAANLGARILVEEAKRIFTPSGLLREGSSHYHLLCLRLYESAADATAQAGRPEAQVLKAVAAKARTAAQAFLMLPGGLPLIGDISPDICPAALLAALDLEAVTGSSQGDGWLRFAQGPWSGLWHAAPEGFCHMPGHGHQDTGGFELHYEDEPVFIDPGRGSYGEHGEAARYRSTAMHNALMLDGADAFAPNRPYYDENFRRLVAGPAPELALTEDGVRLSHHGFCRFAHGGLHARAWHFDGRRMTLQDSLEGRGHATITRTLITPLKPEAIGQRIVIRGKQATYTLDAGDDEITLAPVTRWQAYGRGAPAHALCIKRKASLPFAGTITLEAAANAT
ncbi:MAG: heparinase II/III-family protein [Rhodospirillales bacterium]|nr:heparinase II/III-family protein [Rhodospirillales bacterium]